MDRDLLLGGITRDGITVQIPYMTTYEGYNQRVTLANRHGAPAAYSFTFQPEDGTTATGGQYSSGTLAVGQTMVLSAMDIVDLMGGSRTAATLTIVAPTDSVDVSTTLVNRSTGTAVLTTLTKTD